MIKPVYRKIPTYWWKKEMKLNQKLSQRKAEITSGKSEFDALKCIKFSNELEKAKELEKQQNKEASLFLI